MIGFMTWVLRQKGVVPDADRLILLIKAAGPSGIPERELRSAVELPLQTVDALLAALTQARQVAVADRNGERVYIGR